MINRSIAFKAIIITGASIALSLLLINAIGRPLEDFWIKIYQEISGKKSQHFEYDSDGVPVVVYEGHLGKQYNSVSVAERALKLSEEQDSAGINNFYACINWLINNHSEFNDSSILFLNLYDWPSYGMTSPWRSAMSQGRAAQAFIKAFEKTRDTTYLEYARKSVNALYTGVSEGGVSYFDSTGYWYEEYADENAPQSRVLNGMIVVLEGLYDYYKISGDNGAFFLFNEGVRSVKNNLLLYYNNNGSSYYDILKNPADEWYHNFHIELMDFLYNETGEATFLEFKQKWMEYRFPSYLQSLMQKPTRIGVFSVFTLFVSLTALISLVSLLFRRK